MKKKICIGLLIIMVIYSLLAIHVNAYSFTTTMTPSSSTVTESTEVVITVSVSNLDVGDSGINAFSAELTYDTDVFETLTSSSVEGLNSWASTYSTSTGKIALTKNSFVNDEEEIMQITLKTKSDLDSGTEGIVSLSNIEASNSEDDIEGNDVSTTIEIGTTIVVNSTTNNTSNSSNNSSNNVQNLVVTTNNSTNNTNSNNTNSTITNNSNETNTNSSTDIPYTGTDSSALIKIIIGVALIGIVIFVKMKKISDDIK